MSTKSKRMLLAVASTLLLSFGSIAALNQLLQSEVNSALDEDSRNDGIEVDVHYANYVDTDTLVYSIAAVDADTAPIDVFRAFLQSAEALKDSRYDTVELAYQGEVRFLLDGRYFQEMGEDFEHQNPVYTLRTFPEKLETPSGLSAYGEWTGGMLGVLNKQMNDFNDAMKAWYGADEASRLSEAEAF